MRITSPRGSFTFWRGLRRGWRDVPRERDAFPVLGLLLSLFLTFQLLLGLQEALRNMSATLPGDRLLRVELAAGVAHADAERLFGALQALPGNTTVMYVTREQAYERERARRPEWIALLDRTTSQSPFRDVLLVETGIAASRDALERVLRGSEWMKTVDATALARDADEHVDLLYLRSLLDAGRRVLLLCAALLPLVLLFSLVTFVRRRALLAHEEMTVGRLSGARRFLLILPYAAEAFLLLFLAFGCSVIVIILLSLLPSVSLSAAQILSEQAWGMFPLLGLEILSLPFFALLGAWLGVRPFLE